MSMKTTTKVDALVYMLDAMKRHGIKLKQIDKIRQDELAAIVTQASRVILEGNGGEEYDYEQGICFWCAQPVAPGQDQPHLEGCAFAGLAKLLEIDLSKCKETDPHLHQHQCLKRVGHKDQHQSIAYRWGGVS